MPGSWDEISGQLRSLESAKSADEVIAVLTDAEASPTVWAEYGTSSGDAFFAGSGGDDSVEEALEEAGWRHVWREASYYWAMRAPDGSGVTYVEGDVYRGVQQPIPSAGG